MKKMFLVVAAMAMLVSGCATTTVNRNLLKITSIEDERQTGPYLRMFQTEMMLRGIQFEYPMALRVYISKNLDKRLGNVVGLCRITSNRIRIYLDKDAWERYDDVRREMLMFHELGHCVLDLDHNRSTMLNGTPLSIMYPNLFSPYTYNKYRPQYLDYLAKEFMARYGSPQMDLDLPDRPSKTCILRPSDNFSKKYK